MPTEASMSTFSDDDRYEILRPIGEGSMGIVSEARDHALGRVVAVKSLHPRLANKKGFLDRFVQEAKLSGQLDHPGIIPVYSLDESDHVLRMAMKRVQGQDLQALIDACGEPADTDSLRLEARLEIFVRICEPVAHAHRMNIVHRDLKPENVLLGPEGEVYVVDWGIAKVIGRSEPQLATVPSRRKTETRTGTLLGTPSFMSPEQARGDHSSLDGRSDIYSLGLMLYELVVLERANTGSTALLVATQAQLGFQPQPDAYAVLAANPDLAAIIGRATALEPEDRYPSATALAEDVRRFLRREETDARPDTPWRTLTRWVSEHAERTLTLLFTGLVLAALATTASIVADLREDIQQQAEAHARDAAMAAFIQEVTSKGHGFDRHALHHQSLVESLARTVTRLLSHDPLLAGEIYWHRDRQTHLPPNPHFDDRYQQRVSFSEPTYWSPEPDDDADIRAQALRLYPVRADLRAAMLRSIDRTATSWPAVEQDALLQNANYPTAWSYLALETGLAVTFPGIENYGADYDPRTRPWYTGSQDNIHATWGAVYAESAGSGLMLPCTQTLYDTEGQVLGVVGLDVSLDGIIRDIRMDVVGVNGVWLTDKQGQTLVNSDMEGLLVLKQADEVTLPNTEVRERILSEQPFGWVADERNIFVFTQLPSLGWYYVVRRERDAIEGFGL